MIAGLVLFDGVSGLANPAAASRARRSASAPFDVKRVKQFEAATKSLVHGFDGVLIIDGDNVRGKSQFGLSHASLLARTARWSARNMLSGNVVLLVDHGSLPSAYHLHAWRAWRLPSLARNYRPTTWLRVTWLGFTRADTT